MSQDVIRTVGALKEVLAKFPDDALIGMGVCGEIRAITYVIQTGDNSSEKAVSMVDPQTALIKAIKEGILTRDPN